MQTKKLWVVIVGLIILNCLTVAFFLTSSSEPSKSMEENVASIGDRQITRQQWLGEIEQRYGKDILRDMIDQEVIKQMANKYNVVISDEAIDRELTLIKTMYGGYDQEQLSDENKWRDQIKYSLLLEEILTKDVEIAEEELKRFYEENKMLYNIPTTFHVSHIVVKTEEEAKQAIKELEGDSSFSVLAMERSIDEFTANQGGDIGFISEDDERYPSEIMTKIKQLKENQWSEPLKYDDYYMIVYLHEKVDGKEYSFGEVKDQIRRQIALEQMDMAVSARSFWDEMNVNWFYQNEQ